MRPNLDHWLADPALRVAHERAAATRPSELWAAARTVRLSDTRVLGRVVRWRIPGVPASTAYDELFRSPPFSVLHEDDGLLISGLVGRIWTLRRDYPVLSDPDEFRTWSAPGTARVVFANWVESRDGGGAALLSETRVGVGDGEARAGLTLVRSLVAAFNTMIGSEAMGAAVRRAERGA